MAESPATEIRLDHERSSSCSWRVRIALAWKGLAYESNLMEWASGEMQSDAFRSRSPFGQVPCLSVDGVGISQSMAILELLEELYPEPRLLPPAPIARARAREVAEAVNAGTQPLHNGGLAARLREQFGADGDAFLAWSRYWLERRLGAIDSALSPLSTRYACGAEVTLADVLLYPQLRKAEDRGLELARFPTLARIAANLADLPAFADTGPDSL